MKKLTLFFFTCIWMLLFVSVSPAVAVPIDIHWVNVTGQDVMNPPWSHELGNQFPPDELITSSWTYTEVVPCQWGDSPSIPNVEVTMTNQTGRDWRNVVYVKDPETTIANWDQLQINGQYAFTIDHGVGINNPLVYESKIWDNIFQAGEIWKFVIADYGNTSGLAPSLFGSWDSVNMLGRVGNQSGNDTVSSGSIIVGIPEPAALSLLALGGLTLLRRNRK